MSDQVQTGVEKLCHTIIHIRRPYDDGTAAYPYQVVPEALAEGCERRDERFYDRIDEETTSRSAKPSPNRCGNCPIGRKGYGGNLDESTAENADNQRADTSPKTGIDTIETGEKIHLYHPQNNFKIFPIGPKIHPIRSRIQLPRHIQVAGHRARTSRSITPQQISIFKSLRAASVYYIR